MRHDGVEIMWVPVAQKKWHTAGRQHLGHLMHDALRHRQGAAAHIDHHQQLTLRVHRRPDPGGCTLQTLDGLLITDRTSFEVAQHGIQLIELQLLQV